MTLEELAEATRRVDIRDDAWKKSITDTVCYYLKHTDYMDPDTWIRELIEDLRETANEFIYE